MKKSTLAVAALVTSLSAAIIAPAVYAEDAAPTTSTTTTTTTTPAPACDPKDPTCKPDAATTDGSTAPEAPATGSDS